MKEVWKILKAFPDYMASDLGRIKRSIPGKGTAGKVLKQSVNRRTGYLFVGLRRDGKTYSKDVHGLVMVTFNGTKPIDCECNHKDGIKSHNQSLNLEWITPTQNKAHARQLGLYNDYGENSTNAKLTTHTVKYIRKRYKVGNISQKELGQRFGVCQQQISRILREERWAHVCNISSTLME